MKIEITDDFMRLHDANKIIATATQRADGWWWEVRHWPRFFDRNQVTTALTITEFRCCGRDEPDALPLALREELR
jgi:hypothetical protein